MIIRKINHSKKYILLLMASIAALIVITLLISSPNKDDFITFVKTKSLDSNQTSFSREPIPKTSLNFRGEKMRRHNFAVFSLYAIDVSGFNRLGNDAPQKIYLGIAGEFFPLNENKAYLMLQTWLGREKSKISNTKITCENLNYDDESYFDNLNLVAQEAGMKDWDRDIEDFIWGLCRGNLDEADAAIMAGRVHTDLALRVSRVLGISYSPPMRNTASYLYEVVNKKLEVFMCSACAGNAASYFVVHPNSRTGKLIKNAMDGDVRARDQVQTIDWTSVVRLNK